MPRFDPRQFHWSEVNRYLADRGVTLLTACLDEAPWVYKDIDEVMAVQKNARPSHRPLHAQAGQDGPRRRTAGRLRQIELFNLERNAGRRFLYYYFQLTTIHIGKRIIEFVSIIVFPTASTGILELIPIGFDHLDR